MGSAIAVTRMRRTAGRAAGPTVGAARRGESSMVLFSARAGRAALCATLGVGLGVGCVDVPPGENLSLIHI